MKYLKTYEQTNIPEIRGFWRVKMKDLDISLWKFYNMYSIKKGELFNLTYINTIHKNVLISFTNPKHIGENWGWVEDDNYNYGFRWCMKHDYKYMGELKITKEDRFNYKVEKEAEK